MIITLLVQSFRVPEPCAWLSGARPAQGSTRTPIPPGEVFDDGVSCSLRENDGDDHAVETEGLTEDKNKDHSHEDSVLLSVCADTSVTNNTNCETCCEGGETASEARCEVLVSLSIDVLAISGDYKRRKSLIFNMLIFHFPPTCCLTLLLPNWNFIRL